MNRLMLIMMGINMVNQALMWYAQAAQDNKITNEEYAQLGGLLASGVGQILGYEVKVTIEPLPKFEVEG